MPSSAQRSTRLRPAGVSPGPASGDAGNANGTPVANAFARLHTGPSERRPAACQSSSASSSGSIASAPSRWATAASTPASRARSRSPGARAIATWPARSSRVQPAERPGRFGGRALVADRRREVHVVATVALVDDLLVVGARRERREDPAREAARARLREVEVAALAAGGEAVGVLARQRVVVAVEDRDHASCPASIRFARWKLNSSSPGSAAAATGSSTKAS